MSERVTLVIDDGINAMLTELAGGERKRGQWVSDLVRAMYEQQEMAFSSDFETLKLGFAGMVGQQKQIEGRLLRVEQQLAALIAENMA